MNHESKGFNLAAFLPVALLLTTGDPGACPASVPATDLTFTTVTQGSIVEDVGFSRGCAWGDFDNDGWLDLFASNYGGTQYLFHNRNGQSFTRILLPGHWPGDRHKPTHDVKRLNLLHSWL